MVHFYKIDITGDIYLFGINSGDKNITIPESTIPLSKISRNSWKIVEDLKTAFYIDFQLKVKKQKTKTKQNKIVFREDNNSNI